MSTNPLITIICTVYNEERFLKKALESVMEQNIDFPYEVLVVDDASSDSSPQIIEDFRAKYPSVVRVIRHETNRGISDTWTEACIEARGTYIARIDDDDYWTDANKLKEQLALLESSDDSRWCCTDFDMVDNDGNLVFKDVTASGMFPTINTIDTYENMLAIKSAVASSTWMVERELMLEVNEGLNSEIADEAFFIELELLQRTRLSRITKSMIASRLNIGSGSRPLTVEDAEKRFEGLREQQMYFLKKYPNADKDQICAYLFESDVRKDLEVFKRDREIERLNGIIAENQAKLDQYAGGQGAVATTKRYARSLYHRILKRR